MRFHLPILLLLSSCADPTSDGDTPETVEAVERVETLESDEPAVPNCAGWCAVHL